MFRIEKKVPVVEVQDETLSKLEQFQGSCRGIAKKIKIVVHISIV